ncbi:2-dehydro-3-deoxygalactonokinase [Ideonella sp. A 288]|uniref:2-dehydro-3-deoxygalactonokinase n=1 Tax=Ideonella sp. A 288 TaxID=1962181 RepID=UPI000B4BE714|nr:2-dehydro-3-deoxygalactonokinase [Ideonella sp. A 288]
MTPLPIAPRWLAVDWGTSSLRGALLDAQGGVLDERAAPRGLLTVPAGGWPAVFDQTFGDWLQRWPDLPGLMAGMVGSRQGWAEAPYVACPAALPDLAAHLHWLRPGRLAIVPGLSVDRDGRPDVMRGEEVQIFGALHRLQQRDATVLLPGTHSKWVTVRDGHVVDFATHMTGECYALFRQHSILARGLPEADGPLVPEAFDEGVARAQQPGGLLHHLFGVRTLGLFDRRPPEALASLLSGLVIGEELRARAVAPGLAVVLVGSDALALRYGRALAHRGVQATVVDAQEASWQGLSALAAAMTP